MTRRPFGHPQCLVEELILTQSERRQTPLCPKCLHHISPIHRLKQKQKDLADVWHVDDVSRTLITMAEWYEISNTDSSFSNLWTYPRTMSRSMKRDNQTETSRCFTERDNIEGIRGYESEVPTYNSNCVVQCSEEKLTFGVWRRSRGNTTWTYKFAFGSWGETSFALCTIKWINT